jgi:hypothetical protein
MVPNKQLEVSWWCKSRPYRDYANAHPLGRVDSVIQFVPPEFIDILELPFPFYSRRDPYLYIITSISNPPPHLSSTTHPTPLYGQDGPVL